MPISALRVVRGFLTVAGLEIEGHGHEGLRSDDFWVETFSDHWNEFLQMEDTHSMHHYDPGMSGCCEAPCRWDTVHWRAGGCCVEGLLGV